MAGGWKEIKFGLLNAGCAWPAHSWPAHIADSLTTVTQTLLIPARPHTMSCELQPHCSESAPVQTGGVLWVLPCLMDPAELPAQFTSNFCLSSSFPSSPSGGTGTLKYSPSSWLSSLNLEEDSQGVRAGGGRVPTLLVQETLPQEKVGRIPNLALPDPLSTELPDTYPSRTGFGVLGSTVGLEAGQHPPAQQERALMPPPICQPTPNVLEADEAGWGILSSWLWQSPTVWGQAEFHREQGPPHETGSILRGTGWHWQPSACSQSSHRKRKTLTSNYQKSWRFCSDLRHFTQPQAKLWLCQPSSPAAEWSSNRPGVIYRGCGCSA